MASWDVMLAEAMAEVGDMTTIIACTRTSDEMLVQFDAGYGTENGVPFTAWSEKRVYFPACYDGSEWVASVPRNPCDEHTYHIGG